MDWLKYRNGGVLPGSIDEAGDARLIVGGEEGWLDSFGVVELIAAAETELGVRFTEEDFRNRQFGTLNGFADLADRKIASKRALKPTL